MSPHKILSIQRLNQRNFTVETSGHHYLNQVRVLTNIGEISYVSWNDALRTLYPVSVTLAKNP